MLKDDEGIIPPIEREISQLLRNSSCNLLKVKYIGNKPNEYNYYLMELANGNLTHLPLFYNIKEKNIKTLNFYRNIVEEIRKQVVCLLEKSKYEYVYTDIKLENIL